MNPTANYLPEVKNQYEALPYPARDPADESKRLILTWLDDLKVPWLDTQAAELLQTGGAGRARGQHQCEAVVGAQRTTGAVVEIAKTAVGRAGFLITTIRKRGHRGFDRQGGAVQMVTLAAHDGRYAAADTRTLALLHHLRVAQGLQQIADTQGACGMQDVG